MSAHAHHPHLQADDHDHGGTASGHEAHAGHGGGSSQAGGRHPSSQHDHHARMVADFYNGGTEPLAGTGEP